MGRRLLAVVALIGCSDARPQPAPSPPPRTARPLATGDSNIAAADYIGPEACGACHGREYAAWALSLHRVMNAKADVSEAVIGDFTNVTLRYRDGEVVFARDLAGYTMTTRDRERTTRYRVTRTIGRRALQEYVGVEDGRTEEVRLPFGWWPRYGGWVAQPFFDPWLDEAAFDAYAPAREPWAERCPWCHSTYPFEQRIARASGPRLVGHGFEQHYETSAGGEPHGGPSAGRLAVAQQVSTGISCESCHLGGRAHADGAPIDFLPRGASPRAGAPAFPTTFAEQRTDARVVNGVCAQCHSGPSPRLSDGTALRNSSEALDLAASDCEAKCTDCHDPHRGGVDEARAIAACAGCHATHAQPAHAGRGHAAGAGGGNATTCLDCHMPRIVMGIERYVRTHRISSPTNAQLYAEAAPNACNLCHLDRTIAWTRAELREGWGVALGGATSADGDENVGDVWLASKSPAIRLIAMHAYARSSLGTFARARIDKAARSDAQAYVRAWARFALEEIDRVRRR